MSPGNSLRQLSKGFPASTSCIKETRQFKEARNALSQPFAPIFDGGITPLDGADGLLEINDFVQHRTPVDRSEFEPIDLNLMPNNGTVGFDMSLHKAVGYPNVGSGLYNATSFESTDPDTYGRPSALTLSQQPHSRYSNMLSKYMTNTDQSMAPQHMPSVNQPTTVGSSGAYGSYTLSRSNAQESNMYMEDDWVLNQPSSQLDCSQIPPAPQGLSSAPVTPKQPTEPHVHQEPNPPKPHRAQHLRASTLAFQASRRSNGPSRAALLSDVFAPDFDQNFDDIPMPNASFSDATASLNSFMNDLLARWKTPENDDTIPTTETERHAVAGKLYSAMKSTRTAQDSCRNRWGSTAKRPYNDLVIAYVCEIIVQTAVNLHLRGPATLGIRDEHFLQQVLASRNLKFEQRVRVIMVLVRDFKCRADAIIKGTTLAAVVGAPEEALVSARSNAKNNKVKGENIKAGKEKRGQANARVIEEKLLQIETKRKVDTTEDGKIAKRRR